MNTKDLTIIELTEENIESMIYEVRGQRVMLDFDLARIYGYSTKRFNEQVKNNKEKFDEDFMFQLNDIETDLILRSKKSTSSWGGTRKSPYAFTEKGIYMLMTVLRGELAIQQSKTLIRLFEKMKNYIASSNSLNTINELLKLSNQVNKNTASIEGLRRKSNDAEKQIRVLMDIFVDPLTYERFLIFDGKRIEATLAYQQIYSLAEYSIHIVDDYIDVKTLHLLLAAKKRVAITIVSDNASRNPLQEENILDFIKQSGNQLTLRPSNNLCHDRFIVIDYQTDKERIFISGSSSKDAGNKITTILEDKKIDLYIPLFKRLFN